jgi:hypothetical protein
MSGNPSTDTYAGRWQALLTENSILQKQHHDLLASLIPPFSAGQKAQVQASAAQLKKLDIRVRDLVNDWSAEPRPTA